MAWGGGTLFLMVGNSGSGKDALIHRARQLWPASGPRLVAPCRHITRPAHGSEPFRSLSAAAFGERLRQGRYLFHWQSYGIAYGIPKEIALDLEQGDAVIINVSRRIVNRARQRWPKVRVVFVSVPLAVTAARIRARGRESAGSRSFAQRLARAAANQGFAQADFVLDNSGSLDAGARVLCNYLLSQCGNGSHAGAATPQYSPLP